LADNNQQQNEHLGGFDSETLAKLTTELAGDTELYNKVINIMQEKEQEIVSTREELEDYKRKLEEAEQRSQQYLNQISNLLSKIPIGNSQTPQTFEQKLEEIKNRPWTR
jgi:chromosome segregation ATPase